MRLTRLPAGFATLVVTQCTGTGIAQERKWVVGGVAVLPLDVHSRAGGQVHFDRFRVWSSHTFSIRPGVGRTLLSAALEVDLLFWVLSFDSAVCFSIASTSRSKAADKSVRPTQAGKTA